MRLSNWRPGVSMKLEDAKALCNKGMWVGVGWALQAEESSVRSIIKAITRDQHLKEK